MNNNKISLISPLILTLCLTFQTSFAEFTPLEESSDQHDSSAKTPEEHMVEAEHHKQTAEYHQSMVAHHESLSAEHAKLGHQDIAKNFATIAKYHAELAKEHTAIAKNHEEQAAKGNVTKFSLATEQLSKH